MTAAIAETSSNIHLQQMGVSTDLVSNPFQFKSVGFELPDTSDGGGTFTVTLANYGITDLYDIWVFEHTTKDDVVVTPSTEFTSSVTTGTLTVTFPSGTANVKRVIIVWGV